MQCTFSTSSTCIKLFPITFFNLIDYLCQTFFLIDCRYDTLFLFTFPIALTICIKCQTFFSFFFSINFLYQNIFSLLFSSTICISAVAGASRGGWNPLLNWLIYIPTNVKVLRALSAHAFIMAACIPFSFVFVIMFKGDIISEINNILSSILAYCGQFELFWCEFTPFLVYL